MKEIKYVNKRNRDWLGDWNIILESMFRKGFIEEVIFEFRFRWWKRDSKVKY